MNSRFPKRHPRTGSDRRHAAAGTSVAHLPCLASEWLGDDRLFTPLGHEPGYDYPLLVWLPETQQAATRRKAFDLGKVMQRVSLRNFVAVQPVIGPHESSAAGLPTTGLDEAVWRRASPPDAVVLPAVVRDGAGIPHRSHAPPLPCRRCGACHADLSRQ